MCTADEFEFVTVSMTFADPPGYRFAVGLPALSVTGVGVAAAPEPVPAPAALQ